MATRLVKRITSTGTETVVKNHGPEGSEPEERRHGVRGARGRGSGEAIKAVLTAMRDAGHEVPMVRYDDDLSLWDAASAQFGSFDAVGEALDALPEREEGHALRASEVPASLFPTDASRSAARQDLLDTTCEWCGTAASVKLHGKAGEAGRGACTRHERAVGDALRGQDPTVSREPIRR